MKRPTRQWGDNKKRKCSLCGDEFTGMGSNPEPLKPFEERCCTDCDNTKVIPARLAAMGYSTKSAAEIGKQLNEMEVKHDRTRGNK